MNTILSRIGKIAISVFLLTSLSAHAQTGSDALYQSLGGKTGISTFVNSFVAIVLDEILLELGLSVQKLREQGRYAEDVF